VAIKVNFIFNQTNHGFTETYYKPGSSLPTSLDNETKNLGIAALSFRHPLTTLEWIRFSIVDAPGKSISYRMISRVGAPSTLTSGPDIVQTTALWKITGNNFCRRTVAFRGLVDTQVVRSQTNGYFEPGETLAKGVNNFLNKLFLAGYAIRQAKTPANAGIVARNVTSIVVDPANANNTKVVFDGDIAAQFGAKQQVQFSGTMPNRFLPGWPRTSPVISYAVGPPAYVIIPYRLNSPAIIFQPTNLKITGLDYVYQPMTDWEFQSFTERRTGRPFGSLRGRSRAKVFRQ